MIVSQPWIIKSEDTKGVSRLLDTIIADYGDTDSLSMAGLSVEVGALGWQEDWHVSGNGHG